MWVNVLFVALVLIVVGSLLGEFAGMHQWMGPLWSWFGDQGWEYLDLGRAWQMMLAAGLVLWVVLLYRAIAPRLRGHESSELSALFIAAAVTIPVFYVPAFFYNTASNFTVVDLWRFWIIHLWVENFLELFVTCAVAIIFYQLGIVSSTTASRVVYLDALLYLGSGIIGTGHHWYFTGQGEMTMAFSAVFSAMEVVPLTLLTLDAWDFVALTRGRCDICGEDISVPHRWTFYFLMAVGVWNFVGAGVFGFLINMPIVSYFEAGTMLTPNHAHAAFMGVFGMLAVALMVFAFRQVTPDERWRDIGKVHPRLVLGTERRAGHDDPEQSFPGRRSPAPRRPAKRILACAQRSVRPQHADAGARVGAASWRSNLHRGRGRPARDRRTQNVFRSLPNAGHNTGTGRCRRSGMNAS